MVPWYFGIHAWPQTLFDGGEINARRYPPHIYYPLYYQFTKLPTTSTLRLSTSISRLYRLSRHELQRKNGRKSNNHYIIRRSHHKYYKRELSVQSTSSSII